MATKSQTNVNPVIRVVHLSKIFGAITALDNVSFVVKPGSITGLLGGNGAGKTTTLAMLLGLVKPSSGAIEILGYDLATQREKIAPRMNFESPYVDMPLRLTVRQNLTVYGRLYGVVNLKTQLETIADKLDITALFDRELGKLSSGQKTRVGLAKALLNSPELILLDEPTASLDPDTADWVRRHLADYCKQSGASILMASHNMAEVEILCEDVLMMKQGKIVDQGTPKSLIAQYGRQTMEEVFLDIARGTARKQNTLREI